MRSVIWMLMLSVFFIIGCDGGSSSSGPVNNLQITDIEQPADDAKAGYLLDVSYTVSAVKNTNSAIPVNFYMVNKSQFDETPDTGETLVTNQYYLGAHVTGYLHAGENTLTASLFIPADVETGGDYFLYASLDPDNILDETDEEDNTFVSHIDDNVLISVTTDVADESNIFIDEFILDDPVLVIDDEDIADDNVDLSAEYPEYGDAMLTGYATVVAEGADIAVETINNLRIKAQVYVNDSWRDLYYWDNDAGQYSEYIHFRQIVTEPELLDGVADVQNVEERYTVPFEVNIPDAVLSDMLDAVDVDFDAGIDSYNDFQVRMFIDSTDDLSEEDESDNYAEAYVALYTYPDVRATNHSLTGSKSFKAGNDKKASIEAGMKTETYFVNSSNEKGARISNKIYTKASILGHKRTIVEVNETAASILNQSKGSYGLRFNVLGKNILNKSISLNSINANVTLARIVSDSFVNADFVVGPVPFNLEVGLYEVFGVKKQIKANYQTSTYGILNNGGELPSYSIDLFGSASVGNRIWSVGPVVAFNLIELFVKHTNKVTADYSSNTLRSGNMTNTITGNIKALNGKFGARVKFKTVKICKKWGVPYPCGLKDIQRNFYIYQTKHLINKKSTWFKRSKSVNF